MSFNWQTEDESQWGEEQSNSQTLSRPKYTRPGIWLGLVAFLALSSLLIWRQVDQHLDQTTADFEQDVRASHHLMRQAASDGDSELFVSMLSGRDPAWTDVQLELFERDLLFGNEVSLFGLLPEPTAELTTTVALSADLNEAILMVGQQYRPGNLPNASPITLQHLSIYRHGSQRWLLAPPDDQFWGNWATSAGQHLTLVYPTRDESLALHLQQYLNEKMGLLCQTQLVEACRTGATIRVRLEKEADSLLPLTSPLSILRPEREIILPTFSLVGLPIDPAGEELLLRQYAAIILQTAVVQLTDWPCCRKGTFEQLLLEQMLVELEVMSRPEPTPLYRELLNFSPFNLNPLERLWLTGTPVNPDNPEVKTARAFVDFMQNHSGLTAGELLVRLNEADRFWDWVVTIPGLPTEMEPLTRVWQEHVYLLSQASLQYHPALPDQDLLTVCTDLFGDSSLYRYDIEKNQAILLQEAQADSLFAVTLPNDNGFIAMKSAETLGVSYLYQNGQTTILSDAEQFFYPTPIGIPAGRNLVLGAILNQMGGLNGFAFVDGDNCDPAGCDYQFVDGLPTWSPNGLQYLLLTLDENSLVTWPTADGPQPLGQGFATFWFDNESYGYLSPDNVTTPETERSLMVASTANHTPRRLLAATDLQSFLPADDISSYLRFTAAMIHPADPQTLLLLANSTANLGRAYLFALHRPDTTQSWADLTVESLQIERLQSWPIQLLDFFPLSLSTTYNQWLTLALGDTDNTYLTLYDLQSQQTILQTPVNFSFAFNIGIDWSKDGQWFVRPGEGFLDLVMPAYPGGPAPYHQLIFHNLGQCSLALWVDRQ